MNTKKRLQTKKVTLSDKNILKLAPGIYSGSCVRGLRLKVFPGGARSWQLRFKDRGKDRLMTLGGIEELSVEDAEVMALGLLREKKNGGNLRERKMTFGEYATEFQESPAQAAKSKNWHRGLDRALRVHLLPGIGDVPIYDLTHERIEQLLQSVAVQTRDASGRKRGGSGAARLARDVLRLILRWSRRRGAKISVDELLPTTQDLGDDFKPKRRDRILTLDEVGSIWNLPTRSPHVLAVLRMMTLTGCRISEVTNLSWEDIVTDAAIPHFIIRRSKSDAGRRQIPITDRVQIIISSQAARNRLRGAKPFPVSHGHVREQMRVYGAVKDAVTHDLRRTLCSVAYNEGWLSESLIERFLGHAVKGVSAHYVHGNPLAQYRELMLLYETHIATAIENRITYGLRTNNA